MLYKGDKGFSDSFMSQNVKPTKTEYLMQSKHKKLKLN